MKKFLFNILMIMTLVGGLASCGGDDINTPTYSFLFAENPVMVGAAGGQASAMIITDTDYTPVAMDSWITDVTKESAELITFTVAANTQNSSRDGKIAFYIDGTDDVKELIIRQAAAASGLSANKSEINFTTQGGEETITITAKSNWEIDSCPAWITTEKKNAAALVVSAGTNFEGKTLSGQIVLKTSTESLTIKVSQENNNSLFKNASTSMGRRFTYNCGDLVSRVVTDNSYKVTDGVEALEIKYMSSHTGTELPYYVYIYEIDLNKDVTILASCKNDDPTNIKKTDAETTGVQTLRNQFKALKDKRSTLTVYGGINGDFCYGEGSSVERNALLHGIMHKDGVCLKETFDGGDVCTAFAIMNDGKARIMKKSNYNSYKASIKEAVGGRQIIMDSGVITTVKNGKQDPRTAIGVSADRSKVIMLIIDGRQSTHSNGADYPELGRMFKAMGAYNAINLDGGGSSTFALQSTSDATGFVTRNKPSDKSDRAIPNGLAIVSSK